MSIKPQYVCEVRLKRIAKPVKGRRWRWDVAVFEKTVGQYPGVFDTRDHMTGDFGYSRTKVGALRQIADRMDEYGGLFNLE